MNDITKCAECNLANVRFSKKRNVYGSGECDHVLFWFPCLPASYLSLLQPICVLPAVS